MVNEHYERMLKAHKEKNDSLFNVSAKAWIMETDKCPFKDVDLQKIFSDAKILCVKWQKNGIDVRSSLKRMLAKCHEIAAREVKLEPEEGPDITADIKKEPTSVEPSIKVFGIVPDEKPVKKKKLFGR